VEKIAPVIGKPLQCAVIEESGQLKNIKKGHVIARPRYNISRRHTKTSKKGIRFQNYKWMGTKEGGVVLASIYEDVEQTSIRSQIPHHQTGIASPIFVSQLGCGQAHL